MPIFSRVVFQCRALFLGAFVLALLGCAPAVKRDVVEEKPSELVYPAPPDDPRFYYERMIMSSADVEPIPEEARLRYLLTGAAAAEATPMSKPYAVAVHRGRVFVTDTGGRDVKVFDYPGRRFFRIMETSEGALGKPLGIDVDAQGRVYVADATRKAVYVFDRDGKYLSKIGDAKKFDRLTSVTVNPEGTRVYTVDIGGVSSDKHRVMVFNGQTGEHLFDIGSRGSELGNFNLPRDLAIGKHGKLYVVDGGNFRIQVFDADGKYLNSWGKVGKQLGDFARPKEIATDPEGNVYVIDAAFGNFQIFSPDGELLMFIGDRSEGNGPARYMLPSGIFADEDGRVYVVDQWFRKVDVFRPASIKENSGHLVLGNPAGQPAPAPGAAK